MENQSQPRKSRRSRRKKQMEVIVETSHVDTEALEAQGFKRRRARNEKGHYKADDPSTPENEAFEWVKPIEQEEPVLPAVQQPVSEEPVAQETAPKEEAVSEEPVKAAPAPAPAAKLEPWKRPIRPMTRRQASGTPRGVRKSIR